MNIKINIAGNFPTIKGLQKRRRGLVGMRIPLFMFAG
jgi:hypothetical protein